MEVLPKSLCRLPEALLMNSKARERCLQNSSSTQTVEGTDLSLRQDSWQKRFQWPLQRDLGNRLSIFHKDRILRLKIRRGGKYGKNRD